jgi:hypothetical protein
MEIGAIFEIVEGRLLSVRWDNELEDSLNSILIRGKT